MSRAALPRRTVLPRCLGHHSGRSLTTAEAAHGNGQVSTEEGPQGSRGLPLETSAQDAQSSAPGEAGASRGPRLTAPVSSHAGCQDPRPRTPISTRSLFWQVFPPSSRSKHWTQIGVLALGSPLSCPHCPLRRLGVTGSDPAP